jgi:hypothetical protein
MRNAKIESIKNAIEFKYLTLELTKKALLDEIRALTAELEREVDRDESFSIDFESVADFQHNEVSKTVNLGKGV